MLRIRYVPEDDWHGELVVCAEAAGFRGEASAWVVREQIDRFCRGLAGHPLRTDDPPLLEGGTVVDGRIADAWVRIGVAPLDQVGNLLVTTELATPADPGPRQKLTVQFVTTYAQTDRFAAAMMALLSGGDEAALPGG